MWEILCGAVDEGPLGGRTEPPPMPHNSLRGPDSEEVQYGLIGIPSPIGFYPVYQTHSPGKSLAAEPTESPFDFLGRSEFPSVRDPDSLPFLLPRRERPRERVTCFREVRQSLSC